MPACSWGVDKFKDDFVPPSGISGRPRGEDGLGRGGGGDDGRGRVRFRKCGHDCRGVHHGSGVPHEPRNEELELACLSLHSWLLRFASGSQLPVYSILGNQPLSQFLKGINVTIGHMLYFSRGRKSKWRAVFAFVLFLVVICLLLGNVDPGFQWNPSY